MKISNFVSLGTKGKHFDEVEFAEVDVETGMLWFKKKERKRVCKKTIGAFWFFEDTGNDTPGNEVEKLARADAAKKLSAT